MTNNTPTSSPPPPHISPEVREALDKHTAKVREGVTRVADTDKRPSKR